MDLDKKIYLDNNSTTKLDPDIFNEMKEYFLEKYGNPSCSHNLGIQSQYAIDKSKSRICSMLKLQSPDNLYFTSGATESNNWVIEHTVLRYTNPVIIMSAIEHPSVFETVKYYASQQLCTYKIVNVDENGIIDIEHLKELLDVIVYRSHTLCSIMSVNNEIGSIQPISDIVELLKAYKNTSLHVDATQSIGKLDIDFNGVDFITASAHKIHGPKGIGFLYCKSDIEPMLLGGGQQLNKRSGTENVPGICGFASALSRMIDFQAFYHTELELFRSQIVNKLKTIKSNYNIDYVLNTPMSGEYSICNTINFSFVDSTLSKKLLDYMNSKNIYISAGSACSSNKPVPSRTVFSMTQDENRANNTVRISTSRFTFQYEIDIFLNELENFAKKEKGLL